MKKSQQESSESTGDKRLPRLTIDHLRSIGVASSLTVGAILIGVFLYAQAGLLTQHDTVSSTKQTNNIKETDPQTAKSDKKEIKPVDEASQMDSSAQNESAQDENGQTAKQIPSDRSSAQQNHEKGCNEAAKAAAKNVQSNALTIENSLHQKNLKAIGPISELLGTLKLAKNKVAEENARHQKAIVDINNTYQQAIQNLNCQG